MMEIIQRVGGVVGGQLQRGRPIALFRCSQIPAVGRLRVGGLEVASQDVLAYGNATLSGALVPFKGMSCINVDAVSCVQTPGPFMLCLGVTGFSGLPVPFCGLARVGSHANALFIASAHGTHGLWQPQCSGLFVPLEGSHGVSIGTKPMFAAFTQFISGHGCTGEIICRDGLLDGPFIPAAVMVCDLLLSALDTFQQLLKGIRKLVERLGDVLAARMKFVFSAG